MDFEEDNPMKKRTALDLWCDRQWIKFSLVLSAIMALCMLLFHDTWSDELNVIAAVAVLIPLHVVEEWVFPGGFHYQYNCFMYHSDKPNHYPMCRLSDMITNLVTTILYILFTIYCVVKESVRPGFLMGTAAFSLLEVVMHTVFGIAMYQKFKDKGKTTIYGAGSFTAYFGFGPIGFMAISCLKGCTITGIDIALCIGILLFIAVVCILIPENTIKDKNTPYAFSSAGYFERFLS